MAPALRPRLVALGCGSLGGVGALAGLLVFGLALTSSGGNEFVTGLGIVFGVIYVLVGAVAVAEAGVLYVLTRNGDPGRWSARLLGLGAAAGGIATILLVGSLLPSLAGIVVGRPVSVGSSAPDYAFGVGLWLTPFGIAASGLGAVLSVVSELRAGGDPE